MSERSPDEHDIRSALAAVKDPEIGESIVELGLVDRVEVGDGFVGVTLIPTSATCPMSDLLLDDARNAVVAACPDGTVVDVQLDWDTPWSPERLSPALRLRFGW